MQMKRVLQILAGMLVVVGFYFLGYTVGKNRTVKSEMSISLPIHVQVYQSIKDGDSNRAAALTGMVLMGKTARYDLLTDDPLFRVTAGKTLFKSKNLQKYVTRARDIARSEKTNLVSLGSEESE